MNQIHSFIFKFLYEGSRSPVAYPSRQLAELSVSLASHQDIDIIHNINFSRIFHQESKVKRKLVSSKRIICEMLSPSLATAEDLLSGFQRIFTGLVGLAQDVDIGQPRFNSQGCILNY